MEQPRSNLWNTNIRFERYAERLGLEYGEERKCFQTRSWLSKVQVIKPRIFEDY